MRHHASRILALVFILTLGGAVSFAHAGETPEGAVWLEGTVLVARGMPAPGGDIPMAATSHLLHTADGGIVDLDLTPEQVIALGGPVRLAGSMVRLLVPVGAGDRVRPLAVEWLDRKRAGTDASGSYPYVSLMCAFPDYPLPNEGLPYFLGMYGSSWPGLDHYWRKLSYGMVDVQGSSAAGWFTMPHDNSHYTDMIVGGSHSAMLNALYSDCTAAASGSVNLSDYVGINLMFNHTFGCCAWGGWGGVTWEPPWGWRNAGVIAHEMGHAFGLPHSNNADGDDNPYDNPWDVMSDAHGYTINDSTYGRLGKHTITYHKDILGWITPARKGRVNTVGQHVFLVDHLTRASSTNYHMVQIDIPGSNRFYTVEVRDRFGYDGNLPDFAVIIHEVDPWRGEPAWLVDIEDVTNGADEGAMWRPGECFDDADNEIVICVDWALPEGYRVSVEYGDLDLVLRDGFESGDTTAWSSTTG